MKHEINITAERLKDLLAYAKYAMHEHGNADDPLEVTYNEYATEILDLLSKLIKEKEMKREDVKAALDRCTDAIADGEELSIDDIRLLEIAAGGVDIIGLDDTLQRMFVMGFALGHDTGVIDG